MIGIEPMFLHSKCNVFPLDYISFYKLLVIFYTKSCNYLKKKYLNFKGIFSFYPCFRMKSLRIKCVGLIDICNRMEGE